MLNHNERRIPIDINSSNECKPNPDVSNLPRAINANNRADSTSRTLKQLTTTLEEPLALRFQFSKSQN